MLDDLKNIRWKEAVLRSDVIVALGLVMILLLMIIPLPPLRSEERRVG